MSQGTKVYTVRLEGGLIEDVEIAIEQRNRFSANAPWDLSTFIRIAIREKLSKMQRSRRSSQKRPK